MEKWIDAAVEMTGIDRRTLNALAGEMLLGTGKLLTEEGFTPKSCKSGWRFPEASRPRLWHCWNRT